MLGFNAEIVCDSVHQTRLTTMVLTYPRFIHSEFMTHRMFSRNAASSRAIPIARMLMEVEECPVIPIHWGRNVAGMQAPQELSEQTKEDCKDEWLNARDKAVSAVERLSRMNLHKQVANRLLEPWMWIRVIVTGSEKAWANFFALRCHAAAEPHMQKIAFMAREQYMSPHMRNMIRRLQVGEWHLPLIGFAGDEDIADDDLPKVSAGRCARVSYLTHDGRRDVEEDLKLFRKLSESQPMHASPLEHQAQAGWRRMNGNLSEDWIQFRKTFRGECAE